MIKLSVRQLVERVLRSGDIDGGYVSRDRMLEGSAAHRLLQKINKQNLNGYISEKTLRAQIPFGEATFQLEGRADGIFVIEEQHIVDEIKTTVLPLHRIREDMEPLHWAQAKCYAYLFALEENKEIMGIQLTYYNIETRSSVPFLKSFTFHELETFVMALLEKFARWAKLEQEWIKRRNESIEGLPFPFPNYRKGQRELAVAVFKSIRKQTRLFVQAPTGIGKTISVLYPSIKALREGEIQRIFYLTAKTITRQAPLEALSILKKDGLDVKALVLTAKEKICFCEQTLCNPGYCTYAKGHYDRVDVALMDAFQQEDIFHRGTVEEYARKHHVCPFEFSLDLSMLADVVVCDYNYVFDPRAYLRRFFAEEQAQCVFLLDEAHNLVDRGREMFSSHMGKSVFLEQKKLWKGRHKEYELLLGKINKVMVEFRKACEAYGFFVQKEKPETLMLLLQQYTALCEWMLKEDRALQEDSAFLQLYFEVIGFLGIGDLYDENHMTLVEKNQSDVQIHLLCLDPSGHLREAYKRGRSAVLFSATLSPMSYFKSILGGTEKDWNLSLDSPFDQKRLSLLAAQHVSTKYHKRDESKEEISSLIHEFVLGKIGNYMVYFPSYRYMKEVYDVFTQHHPQVQTVLQKPSLSEEEREDFLDQFREQPEESFVGFCVLGGLFSEGIDLKGQRLIGAAIVSVGLPQINVRQDLLKAHFEDKYGMGFEFAYMYPGMNKVFQATGRVIRSEEDRGVVLFIDERYGQRHYRRLFPKHWDDCQPVNNERELAVALHKFWSGEEV